MSTVYFGNPGRIGAVRCMFTFTARSCKLVHVTWLPTIESHSYTLGGNRLSAHVTTWISHYGLLAVFFLMALESCCIPIPSELVMPYAGYLSSQHDLSFTGAIIVSTIANVLGGLVAYWIGHAGGRAFINRYGKYVLLSTDHVDRAERWFARRGEWTVLIGRLLPAFRTFISLPAGIAEMPLWRFLIYSALGSLPWNIALTYAGYYLGRHWESVGHALKPLTYGAIVLFVLAVLWVWLGRRRARRGR